MRKFIGSHDIAHCLGTNCSKAGICTRSLASKDIAENQEKYKDGRFSYITAKECIANNYSNYWEYTR